MTITDRERAVWLGVCAGYTEAHLADKLRVSIGTIRSTRATLTARLSVPAGDVAALVRAAASAGLLDELRPLNLTPQPTALAHW